MPEKIIFLDIDGVLVPLTKVHNTLEQWYGKAYPFNSDCVIVLNEILDKTNAEIVLISNWQFQFDLAQIQKIFRYNRVNKTPFAFCGEYGNDKVSDIKNYIHENEIVNYVVLDDEDFNLLDLNFIQIDKFTGLTDDYADEIITTLNDIQDK